MSSKQLVPVLIGLVLLATAGGAEDPLPAEASPQIFADVPATIDPGARYLIYLHGAIIETQGVRPTHFRFGVYEYREILEVLAGRGFVVISQARPAGTEVVAYAEEVVGQVRELLAAGVPPEHVTVVGFSKGGAIAITASSFLANDRLNFVFMGACGTLYESRPEIVPRGHLLGLREASDELVGPCETIFGRAAGGERREMVTELGGGHGAFYRPRPEWVDPVVEWASVGP